MNIAIVAVIVVVVIVASARGAAHVRHPEDLSSHTDEAPDDRSERFYRAADRPAGPDAEEMVAPSADNAREREQQPPP